MIAFDLECSNGHEFECWFQNSESFEEQNRKNLIVCPYCDDTKIRKLLSPVKTKRKAENPGDLVPQTMDYRRLALQVLEHINKNYDNVGSDFTNQALKMHYGVTQKKNIRGSATLDEEKLLKEEGIDYFKFPVLKASDDTEN